MIVFWIVSETKMSDERPIRCSKRESCIVIFTFLIWFTRSFCYPSSPYMHWPVCILKHSHKKFKITLTPLCKQSKIIFSLNPLGCILAKVCIISVLHIDIWSSILTRLMLAEIGFTHIFCHCMHCYTDIHKNEKSKTLLCICNTAHLILEYILAMT